MIESVDELVKQVGESGTQMVRDDAPMTLPFMEIEFMLLSANFKKFRKKVPSAKAELDAFRAVAGLATKEKRVALAKVRGELQEKFKT